MSTIYFATTCPTCCKAPDAPFRVYSPEGKIINGCVDHFHEGHLVSPSQSSAWHHRKEAKAIRAASRKMRGGCVTEYRRDA